MNLRLKQPLQNPWSFSPICFLLTSESWNFHLASPLEFDWSVLLQIIAQFHFPASSLRVQRLYVVPYQFPFSYQLSTMEYSPLQLSTFFYGCSFTSACPQHTPLFYLCLPQAWYSWLLRCVHWLVCCSRYPKSLNPSINIRPQRHEPCLFGSPGESERV